MFNYAIRKKSVSNNDSGSLNVVKSASTDGTDNASGINYASDNVCASRDATNCISVSKNVGNNVFDSEDATSNDYAPRSATIFVSAS